MEEGERRRGRGRNVGKERIEKRFKVGGAGGRVDIMVDGVFSVICILVCNTRCD